MGKWIAITTEDAAKGDELLNTVESYARSELNRTDKNLLYKNSAIHIGVRKRSAFEKICDYIADIRPESLSVTVILSDNTNGDGIGIAYTSESIIDEKGSPGSRGYDVKESLWGAVSFEPSVAHQHPKK